jgi:hypothetical protein
LIRSAAFYTREYPQYKKHFDDYRLVRVTADIVTKMGLAFTRGELAIASPHPANFGVDGVSNGIAYVTVWSARNRCDTVIERAEIELL